MDDPTRQAILDHLDAVVQIISDATATALDPDLGIVLERVTDAVAALAVDHDA